MSPEDARNKIADIQILRSRLNRWRTGLPLSIITIVTVCVLMIYDAGESLAREGPRKEEFVAEVSRGLEQNVQPLVEQVAYQTMQETKNSVLDEIDKINARTPEITKALSKEIELLVNNVPMRGRLVMSQTFGQALKKSEPRLRKMFPDVDEEKIGAFVVRLTDLAAEQSEHAADALFERHLVEIDSILTDLELIRGSEKVQANQTMASWEMALLVFDIIRKEFDEVSAMSEPDSPPSPAKPAGTPQPAQKP